MQVGWSILLIIHGILAVFLLGAITHQAVGAAWPVTKRGSGFFSSVRGVNGMSYTNAVIVRGDFHARLHHLSNLPDQRADGPARIPAVQARGDVRDEGASVGLVVGAPARLLDFMEQGVGSQSRGAHGADKLN